MTTPKEDANAIMHAATHPEAYCPVCWKKAGVCKHTRVKKTQVEKAQEKKKGGIKNVLL